MTRPDKSIASSITRLVFGLTLFIALLFSLLVILYAWVIEDNIFNRLVAAEAQNIEKTWLTEALIAQPQSPFMRLHSNWDELPANIYSLWLSEPERVEFPVGDKTLHIKVLHLNGKLHILSADVGKFEVTRDFISPVSIWLATLIVVVSLLVSVLAWWLIKRQLHPLVMLANEVRQLKEGNKESGFSEKYPNNEMGLLATTIEEQFLALNLALQRETHFTRDVSHEIRTPISIQKNILDKQKQGKELLSNQEVASLKETNYQLESITNTLLALARNESTENSLITLNEVIESAILNHFELNNSAQGQSLELELILEENIQVLANPQLVDILHQNLISNAIHFANNLPLRILLTEDSLTFENHYEQGPPEGFTEPGAKSEQSPGIGQGLSLTSRICDSLGWKFSAAAEHGLFQIKMQLPSITPE